MSEQERNEEQLEELLWTGSDVAGAAVGATIGLVIGGPPGAVAGSASGPAIARVFRYIGSEFKARVLGEREEVRVGAVLAFAGEKIRARRWVERALGAFLIGFAAKLALTDR